MHTHMRLAIVISIGGI